MLQLVFAFLKFLKTKELFYGRVLEGAVVKAEFFMVMQGLSGIKNKLKVSFEIFLH